MKKLLFLGVSILLFTGCFGGEDELVDEKETEQESSWSGPTEGPWENWDRSNNGDQYLKYELTYGDVSRTGWVTIDVNDLGNDQYEFNVELHVDNYYQVGVMPDGKTSYNGTANFTLDKNEGFFEATYEKGEMSEIIYEIIGRIDEQSAIVVDFDPDSIVWETGGTARHEGNRVTVNTNASTSVLGVSGYEVEMEYDSLENGSREYIISPDIRYPLYIFEATADDINFYEFTLVEYR